MTEENVQEILALAISAHRDGNFQEAEKYYTSILNAQPNHADANHNMGVLAVQFNKVKLSLPFFRRALDANDNVLQFWHSYLDALVKEGDRDLGLKVLAEAKKRGLRSEIYCYYKFRKVHSFPFPGRCSSNCKKFLRIC